MTESGTRRSPADATREQMAARWMSEGLSAEAWAAHNAHDILAFSFHEYWYSDPALDAWVQELARVLFTPGAVAAARLRFLTAEELAEALRREAEAWGGLIPNSDGSFSLDAALFERGEDDEQ